MQRCARGGVIRRDHVVGSQDVSSLLVICVPTRHAPKIELGSRVRHASPRPPTASIRVPCFFRRFADATPLPISRKRVNPLPALTGVPLRVERIGPVYGRVAVREQDRKVESRRVVQICVDFGCGSQPAIPVGEVRRPRDRWPVRVSGLERVGLGSCPDRQQPVLTGNPFAGESVPNVNRAIRDGVPWSASTKAFMA